MTEIEPNTLERIAKMLSENEAKLRSMEIMLKVAQQKINAYEPSLNEIANIMTDKTTSSKTRNALFTAMKPIRDLYDNVQNDKRGEDSQVAD